MTTVQVLRKARALIKKGWCQGAYAQTAGGSPVDEFSGSAVRFCTVGALIAVGASRPITPATPYQLLVQVTGAHKTSLSTWNDFIGRTQKDVVAAFDRAIKLASK